jgi:hypothetical protein
MSGSKVLRTYNINHYYDIIIIDYRIKVSNHLNPSMEH